MVGSDTEATVMLNVVPGMNTGITAFNAGLSSINAQFQNITDTIGSTFGLMDAMIVSSGAMIVQFGMGAANAFGEFEQGMRIVKAVSQQSGESIAYLTQQAQDFSIQYRTDIDSITEGLQTLGRAGLNSAQEQTEVLEQGLQTAKLEGRDLNGVLEEIIQNTSLLGGDIRSDQFGEQAEYLNNLLVGTSLSAPLDTHDISETLKYSGGMVAAAGGTIATEDGYANEAGREIVEDYMGAVAAFAQKGVKGSIAGTALRAFFNKPAAQDQSVVDALSTIGLAPEDLWDNEETMKPVSEQIELIQTQMAAHNVSKMDQMQLWSKIVGGKMGQQMMKLDAQEIREMTTDIQDASSARDLAEQTFNTYNQKMNKLNEESQKLFRDFGEHIVTAIRPALEILDKLAEILNNPVFSGGVTFAGFTAFVAILSHGLRAVLRIARRLRQELSLLFGGGLNSFNPQAMLSNARMGRFNQPYINLQRPSEVTDYLKHKISLRGTPSKSQHIDDMKSNMQQKTESVKNHFKSFGDSFKTTMKGVSTEINDTMNQVSEKIKSVDFNVDTNIDEIKQEIKTIEGTVSEVMESTIVKAKQTADYIITQNNAIKADMIDLASSRYSGPVGAQSNLVGVTKEELSQHTVPVLKDILMTQHGYSKADIRALGKKDNLIDEIFRLNNYDATQIINGAAAINDLDVADVYRNDPYFRNMVNPSGHSLKGYNTEDMRFLVNKREFLEGGMFPAHIPYLPADAQLFADTMNRYDSTKLDIMEENAQLRVENPEEVSILDGIFKAVEAIHNNMVIEDHDVNEAYYDKHTSMRDAFNEEEKRLNENNRKFKENYFWGKTKDNKYGTDEGLEALFDDSNSSRTRNKFWGGMTEEEFNKQYRRYTADAWELDKNEINWADDVSEKTKAQVEQMIDKQNAGLLESVPYVVSQRDTQGLGALFGDEVAPEKQFEGYSKEASRREKLHSKLNKGVDKVSEKFDGFAKSLGSTKTSTIGKAVDILGGPFSVAIMGATAAMEIYNYAFGQWQKQVQEHQTKLSEAQNSLSEAEGNIREEYLKNNPDATPEEADQAISDAYLAIEDNNYDISALDANTQALYVATYQVQRASDLLEGDAMDGNFGINGTYTSISDGISGFFNLMTGNTGTAIVLDSGEFSDLWSTFGTNVHSGSITDNQGNAVLTASQNSDDYIYSKENAAIFAADVWTALDDGLDKIDTESGNVENIRGLDNFFGSDSQHFKEVTQSIFRGNQTFGGSAYDTMTTMLAKNFQQEGTQHQLQMFLKNNQKDAQKLAKDIRKFEKANKGRNPLSFFTDSKGRRVSQDKALKNLEVKDKDLVKYLRSLSIKTGMSAQQLLMASQLQQMQDLNQIMTEQLQPQVVGLAQNAYQQLSAQGQIGSNTSSTSSGSWSTYNAAAAIASKLNVLVEQALDTEMQQDYIAAGGQNQEYIDNPQKMKADMVKAFNTPENQRTEQQKTLVNTYGKKWFESYYLSAWDTGHPDATPEQREGALKNFDKTMAQYDNFGKLVADTRKGANAYYTNALLAAYDASSLGESSSPASGGSGGSGSDGKDKDSGTKKERVDLVLCNKKEIPKLNVNLFKKAPQFTVLNKNFKLRDIKINTQDKPKAVLASLKNAIIDTQKRMDPKIIQDEEAEYDPVAATDGNSTPSGSTSTTTDD